jgi:hypothetical protein
MTNLEFDSQGRLFGIYRTELELKAIQFFKDVLNEPFEEDQLKSPQHLLCEFCDGYSKNDEGYSEYNFEQSIPL